MNTKLLSYLAAGAVAILLLSSLTTLVLVSRSSNTNPVGGPNSTNLDELVLSQSLTVRGGSLDLILLTVPSGSSTVFTQNDTGATRWFVRQHLTTSGTTTAAAYRAQCATTTVPATIVSGTGGGTRLPLYSSLSYAPLMDTGTIATSSGPQSRLGSSTPTIALPWLAGEYLGCVVQAVDRIPGGITAVQPATSTLNGLGTMNILFEIRSTSSSASL